jgi:predicted Zn-dependent protease
MKVDAQSVLGAMEAELARSMDGLAVPDAPDLYYLSYSMRRHEWLVLRAGHGSLQRTRNNSEAKLYVEARVGDHHFDNVMDGGLDEAEDDLESRDWSDAPDDLNPDGLRLALWKLTQLRFEEAQEDYFDHEKALVAEYLRDEVDSLSHEKPVEHIEALSDDSFPRDKWEAMLVELSRRFFDHPEVYQPWIGLKAERVQRWLCNSEGTRVVTEDLYIEVVVEGWVLTEDGVYVQSERARYLRDLAQVPTATELSALVDEMLEDLEGLRDADSPGSFIGPALLAGQAAATMFHEALGHRLEGERLVARGETRTFARRQGERILPTGLDVYDDPNLTDADGRPEWGSYRVDDEGVRAQRADLVKDGILSGFLTSRAPIPGSRRSNGHGRHDGLERPMARMANLVIEAGSDHQQAQQDLETQLVQIAKEQGRRHAAIILRIRGGETSTNSYEFQVFKGELAEIYLLDVETGERRRIRDVELIGTPLAAMQRIVGFGGSPQPDPGHCVAESGAVPVSGRAPSVLLSEVELQQRSTTGYHEPLLPPPFADDGSRGRVGGKRERGRRKRDSD